MSLWGALNTLIIKNLYKNEVQHKKNHFTGEIIQ